MAPLKIRRATPEDTLALIELAVEAFGESARAIAEDEFQTIGQAVRCQLHMLVALKDDVIIGMASLCENYSYIDTYCLAWVAVKKEHQGQGIGTSLVRDSIELAKTLTERKHGCVMLVSADRNLAYYTQLGFKGQTQIHPYIDETSNGTILTYIFKT